jgi:dihydrofolate reductase
MIISLVAAFGKNRELGLRNRLLWNLPDDMKQFRKVTTGKPVIMGRKTFESIGHALPNRQNIVISRDETYRAPKCTVVSSLVDAFAATRPAKEVCVIGGGEIYKLALPFSTKMYITLVHEKFDADAFFPRFSSKDWNIISSERHAADERHPYTFTFEVLERKKPL